LKREGSLRNQYRLKSEKSAKPKAKQRASLFSGVVFFPGRNELTSSPSLEKRGELKELV